MRLITFTIAFLLLFLKMVSAQPDTLYAKTDSLNSSILEEYNRKLREIEQQRIADSIGKAELEKQLDKMRSGDNLEKIKLQGKLKEIEEREKSLKQYKQNRIDSLRKTASGFAVTGVLGDTLYRVYARLGAVSAKERAENISTRIQKLYDDDFFKPDSVILMKSDYTTDLVYGELIVLSVTETDALWQGKSQTELASEYKDLILNSIAKARDEYSLVKILTRIGLVILVLLIVWLLIKLIAKAFNQLQKYIDSNKDKWLKDLSYHDYTFLTAEQELRIMMISVNLLRLFIYFLTAYITLPILFSIFPFTRGWADDLFLLIWAPFTGIFVAVWDYLPNLIRILVIFIVMKYFIRLVKYIFDEIESGKLRINGFYSDWAMPTFSVLRILLYAFFFVMIFPYLPGSDSDIFKGVSVFLGVLFSLGSSSAIANMVAGMVITYMRPFKIGDRIKIGDITGDVVEKTLLVTRLRTPKNEEITIPNSTVLSGNTTNYSSYAKKDGLIIHTTVTIGYDVPWKDIEQALIDAASRTNLLLKDPPPFVLQTSLEDFYVAYQLNAFTKDAGRQAVIFSDLHRNIQDCCNERGIEIMSPHYRAARDGSMSTIPASYLPEDYSAPAITVALKSEKKEENK